MKLETNNLLNLLKHAAKEATPNSDPQRTTNNIYYEIKKLVAEKRRSRSIWQRTHTSAVEEYITEQATNLNPTPKKRGTNPLKNTFLILKGKTTLFGNLQKIGENPKQDHPQYANIQHLPIENKLLIYKAVIKPIWSYG